MIKICTTYFKGKYSPDYVSKLYRGLKKYSTIPFEFICLSDTKDVEADIVLPYNHHSDIKLHWHKLKFFSPQFAYQNPNDEIIIMDIDQVIVNNIDEMIGWPVSDNELVTYNSWWNNNLPINGGWSKFKSGHTKILWDTFVSNPNFWQLHYYNKGDVHFKYYGEQNFVYDKCRKNNIKITLMPPQWIGKYQNELKLKIEHNRMYSEKFNTDYMILGDDVDENLKIVHFAGVEDKVHECDDVWIRKYWV